MLQLFSTLSILTICALSVRADVGGATGTPVGFAFNVTGGGNATPATPTSTAQLISWLEDDVARVITIDREFNFIGTEGTCKDCAGCIPKSNTCGSAGQNAIDTPGKSWCDGNPSTSVTYDKAAIEGISVGSHKSLIGVGNSAVIRGKGLRMVNGASNVIIQNIHFTEMNSHLIWGGDAISVDGSDLIWVDHCKFSLIGRQMFVAGMKESGNITLSFNEFDGQTNTSNTCNGKHYWTILGYGDNDHITLYGNYIHHTSGRSPRLEYNSVWHAVSNYWYDNPGHAFDVAIGANAVIEGNVFENVTTPLIPQASAGKAFVPTNSTAASCSTNLGRQCQSNILIDSGKLVGAKLAGDDLDFLKDFKRYGAAPSHQASVTKSFVLQNAGVGKL